MMKKILISAFTAICIFVLLAFSASAVTVDESALRMRGDLDGNGKITADDARLCLRASVKLDKLSKEDMKIADITGDGKVDPNDARKILRAAVSLEMVTPKGHIHEYMDGMGGDPTCTTPGYSMYWCKGCEHTFFTFTKAFGHSLDENYCCVNCGNYYLISILENTYSVNLKPGGTKILRLVVIADDEGTFSIVSKDSDSVKVGMSDVYTDEDGLSYRYLFIVASKNNLSNVKVDISFDDEPGVGGKTVLVSTSSGAPSTISVEGITVPDLGTYLGIAPVGVNTIDTDEGFLSGFLFSYNLQAKAYSYYSGIVDTAMTNNGFLYEDSDFTTINGVNCTIKTFRNFRTGVVIDIGFYIASDGNTVTGIEYAFGAE